MSRKTIGFVVAILASILAVFQKQFGLSIDPTTIAAVVGSILTYVFFEAKLDLKALASQPSKWKDPKFWLTVLSAVLAGVEATLGLGIPVESIIAILTTIVGVLFGVQLSKAKAY